MTSEKILAKFFGYNFTLKKPADRIFEAYIKWPPRNWNDFQKVELFDHNDSRIQNIISSAAMATKNGKSCEHITNFFLNLIHMHFLADPNAAEVKLIKSWF